MGALDGTLVLDLTRVLAGPWATQLLADYGAEVIKIEQPGKGDDTRAWGPPYLPDAEGKPTTESAYFLSANRNKRSVAVNLADPEGQALICALAQQADVLVENFKVGALARYGLDYASLQALNPRLIYCSITGFGQDGPRAQEAGYDAMIQAMGGLMSITGHPDEVPGGGPMKVGIAVVDLMCGMYASNAVLAALHHRARSGRGQQIDVALFDTQLAWLSHLAMNHLVAGVEPTRHGSAHASIVPYQAFATADGHLMLTVGNDAQYLRFCEAAEVPALASDPRYQRNADRVRHRDTLLAALQPLLRTRTTADWLARLQAAGVPCGPINTIAQAFADPQARSRQMCQEIAHPIAGTLPLVAHPVRFSDSPATIRCAPPLLSADTDHVLGTRLGLDAGALAALRTRGVIG